MGSQPRPLAHAVAAGLRTWLPKATYPVRHGVHGNSAFGLARALPYAKDRADASDAALLEAITTAAQQWYANDADYPGRWKPSGTDFLSPRWLKPS